MGVPLWMQTWMCEAEKMIGDNENSNTGSKGGLITKYNAYAEREFGFLRRWGLVRGVFVTLVFIGCHLHVREQLQPMSGRYAQPHVLQILNLIDVYGSSLWRARDVAASIPIGGKDSKESFVHFAARFFRCVSEAVVVCRTLDHTHFVRNVAEPCGRIFLCARGSAQITRTAASAHALSGHVFGRGCWYACLFVCV